MKKKLKVLILTILIVAISTIVFADVGSFESYDSGSDWDSDYSSYDSGSSWDWDSDYDSHDSDWRK